MFSWIGRYLELTTFEISIPALRGPSLAPPGKSGVIASTMFDHDLAKHLEAQGWYGEFKDFAAAKVAKILDDSIFSRFAASICDSAVATPLSLERMTGNLEGAITGWAFTNPTIPAETQLIKIAKAICTPIPGVCQAGQWSFSPAGLQLSILTGKLAADRIIKEARRKKRDAKM